MIVYNVMRINRDQFLNIFLVEQEEILALKVRSIYSIFFIIFILVGVFFLLNVLLAVIFDNFKSRVEISREGKANKRIEYINQFFDKFVLEVFVPNNDCHRPPPALRAHGTIRNKCAVSADAAFASD